MRLLLFLVSVRINSFQAWFNNSLNWWFPGDIETHSQLTDIFGLTYLLSIPISPVPGMIVDFCATKYQKQGDSVKGNRVGLAVMVTVCSLLAAILSFLSTIRGSFFASSKSPKILQWQKLKLLVTCQIVFSICRTFSYAVMAQAVFLLYPSDLFGAIFGSISLANGTISLIADPLFRLAFKKVVFKKVPNFKEPQFDRKKGLYRIVWTEIIQLYTMFLVYYAYWVLLNQLFLSMLKTEQTNKIN